MKVKWLSLLMAMLMTLNSIMLVSVIADDAVNYEEDVKVYSGEITEASDL